MADEQFKRSDFLAAAKDLINTMGLKDDKGKPLPIDAKSNVAQLTKFILSATEEIDPGSDEFKPETLAILSHVGYTGFSPAEEIIPEEIVEPPAEPVKKSKPKEDLAEDADWKEPEPAEPLTLQQQVAAAKRLADLKDLVTGNLEFKKLVPKLKSYMGLAGPRMLKAEMQKIVGIPEIVKVKKPVKEKVEKPAKEKTERSYTKIQAICDTIKSLTQTVTSKELFEKIGTQYEKMTDTINSEPEKFAGAYINAFVTYGVLKKENGTFIKML